MTQNEIEIETLYRKHLVEFARIFIGIKEVGGNNRGEFVSMFQKAVDGKAQGEAWCAAAVSYWIKTSTRILSDSLGADIAISSPLQLSESVCNFYFNNSEKYRLSKPQVGSLILWRRWANGKSTWQGHIGIVADIVNDDVVRTIEGNTSSDGPNQREGDGVFLKSRSITRHYGSLRPLGFMKVY